MDTDRFLITTADERSWKSDRPILFLGEWCRLYSRKDVWSGMEARVADPFGLEKDKKEKDRIYVQSLSKQLLAELTDSLNEFHNTGHDERFWNILLGSWLKRFVSVAFNRYFSLEQALKENKISGTVIFDLPDYSLATPNTIDFQWALHDNMWNHMFYVKLLRFWGLTQFESVKLPENEQNCYSHKINTKNEPNIKKTIRDLWNLTFQKFTRSNDALIINSYLPFKYVVKLQLSLGQFPGFWTNQNIQNFPVNSGIRSNFKINPQGFTGFELFVRNMLWEVVPTCYLEGFNQLKQQSESLPWPRNPRFIFTSNNFDTDELFKVWTAHKVEKGHKYYIGQHGNNYGTWIYHNNEIPEFSTPDKFISWGWTNANPIICPAFIFKTVNKPTARKISKGGLLLIERCLYNRMSTFDSHVIYDIYQKEQYEFVASLQKKVQALLTVRIHLNKPSNLSWSDEQRWRDFDPSIKLDSGETAIWNLIDNNRLVVYSYDSTGFLETLFLNIPCLSFWHGLMDEILPDALPYYELLKETGLLAESPEDAAKLVNLYWDNIDEWWYSKPVQHARSVFCDKYAKTVANPIRELKKILTTNLITS